jgi:hypothetical protein
MPDPDPHEISDAEARAAAARDAMSRAVDMTDSARAESARTLSMTVLRLREAARRSCELCSGRAARLGRRDGEAAACTCAVRCTSGACQRDPELAEGDGSIP